ncbi:MAG TPA: helix-turn-helix domain-containing protein [Solirubrobacterales bacterium]
MRQASAERERVLDLAERLRERRGEIEEVALLRTKALADPPQMSEAEYAQGLQRAVSIALQYGIEGIEREEEQAPAPPPELLSQARLAARNRVSLDVVLRRYVAGQALLGDFLLAEAADLPPAEAKRALRRLSALLDRLLAAVSVAYAEEKERRQRGSERQRTERIERLLAGEPLETAGLAYNFDAHHLAALAQGAGARQLLDALARELDARLLIVEREGSLIWAWLGTRAPLEPERALRVAGREPPPEVRLSLGEPGEGMAGWQLSHRQAAAAMAVAIGGEEPVVRYADVALLASALQDELLATSLRRLYLAPLEAERDGGEVLRETLRAYFTAGRNVSSAAAVLGVTRQTIANRLRAVEECVGSTMALGEAEMEISLRLDEMTGFPYGKGL